MLATVLAQPAETPRARAVMWRQLVDLAAQRRGGDPALMLQAAERLRALRDRVPAAVRAEVARAIAGRPLPPAIVALFAEEPAAIAAPMLTVATLPAEEWLALLPTLPISSRALLRHREDLPQEVATALASFGSSDFALGDGSTAIEALSVTDPSDAAGQQIRDLMARIDAFKKRRTAEGQDLAQGAAGTIHPGTFRFEADAEGTIKWAAGIAREPLIGETIALPGEGAQGVDGHVAGAFRRRASFRDARLSVAGEGPASGEWRISAVPFFDSVDGRFLGYRGTGRRPRADERAQVPDGLFGSGMAADSLRQLVHELRTPINAISGFAEMIEQQMLGPIVDIYRAHATDIVTQAQRLLGAIDDLDVAARIETQRLQLVRESVDVAALLATTAAEHGALAMERGAKIVLAIAAGAAHAAVDMSAITRMCARLVAATVGLAERGETITLALAEEGDQLRVSVTRPAVLAGQDEPALLDPGFGPEGESPDAPALGLGFSLRLVRNLAAAAQGTLEIGPERFELRLPIDGDEARVEGRG